MSYNYLHIKRYLIPNMNNKMITGAIAVSVVIAGSLVYYFWPSLFPPADEEFVEFVEWNGGMNIPDGLWPTQGHDYQRTSHVPGNWSAVIQNYGPLWHRKPTMYGTEILAGELDQRVISGWRVDDTTAFLPLFDSKGEIVMGLPSLVDYAEPMGETITFSTIGGKGYVATYLDFNPQYHDGRGEDTLMIAGEDGIITNLTLPIGDYVQGYPMMGDFDGNDNPEVIIQSIIDGTPTVTCFELAGQKLNKKWSSQIGEKNDEPFTFIADLFKATLTYSDIHDSVIMLTDNGENVVCLDAISGSIYTEYDFHILAATLSAASIKTPKGEPAMFVTLSAKPEGGDWSTAYNAHYTVRCVTEEGTEVWNFTQTSARANSMQHGFSIADVQNGSHQEIIVTISNLVMCFDQSGQVLWSYEIPLASDNCEFEISPPITADLDGDGTVETIVSYGFSPPDKVEISEAGILIISSTGSELFKIDTHGFGRLSISDLNSDGTLEIIQGEFVGFGSDGDFNTLMPPGSGLWVYGDTVKNAELLETNPNPVAYLYADGGTPTDIYFDVIIYNTGSKDCPAIGYEIIDELTGLLRARGVTEAIAADGHTKIDVSFKYILNEPRIYRLSIDYENEVAENCEMDNIGYMWKWWVD